MKFWKRLPRIRKAQPADLIRVNGKLHMVRSISWPGGHVAVEPLGDVLARSIAVDDGNGPTSLADALIEAGWSPPESV